MHSTLVLVTLENIGSYTLFLVMQLQLTIVLYFFNKTVKFT